MVNFLELKKVLLEKSFMIINSGVSRLKLNNVPKEILRKCGESVTPTKKKTRVEIENQFQPTNPHIHGATPMPPNSNVGQA